MRVWRAAAAVGVVWLAGCGTADREAEREFRAALGAATVTVFPAAVLSGGTASHDEEAAREIAEFLTKRGLARAEVSRERPALNRQWGHNQAGMWRRSQTAFVEHLAAHPVTTDYAFMAEYLVGKNGAAGGVHGYVVKADGKRAYGFLLNSHHRLFRKIRPRSNADCRRLVMEYLEKELRVGR